MDLEKIRLFCETFSGRDDCYGAEGRGCIKEPITDQVIWNHLVGEQRIGIYPIFDKNKCRWIAVDFDKDNIELAKRFYEECSNHGIKAYVERSKSKG